MILERIPEISKLTPEDKRRLINELWDEIEESDARIPDPEIIEILEKRWKEFEEDPSGAITLEEFRNRVRSL